METTAAVLEAPGSAFTLTELTIDNPAPGEVLIEVLGVGLCHTDLAVRDGHLPFPFPAVVGHEGSGIVRAIGDGVTGLSVGDRVCASFNSCGTCSMCVEDAPSYCLQFMPLNFAGSRLDGSTSLRRGSEPMGSNFFGQSTFAAHAIANQRNLVKVPESVPLEIAGPLGCGIQTGAGAIMNSLACKAGSTLLITGGGSVGLAAVLGAVAREVGVIIVSEPVPKRRELALALGATHAIDPLAGPLSEQVRKILPEGVDYALDTTAHNTVLTEVLASLGQKGHLGMVGVPGDPAAQLSVGLIELQARGLTFTGIVEGDSDPQTFIPALIDLHLEGKFPFEKLITTMPFSQINEAVALQARGDAVKVVLTH